MFDWIKRHKLLFILICIFIFFLTIGTPFIINLLFKLDFNIYIFRAEWSAGDALSYYGAILSFIGTVVLGALALYQNHVIKEESDKRAAKIEELERIQNMPRFYLRLLGTNGFNRNFILSINNISINSVYDIEVYKVKIQKNENNIWETEDTYTSPIINPQEHINFTVKTSVQKEEKDLIFIAEMKCKDIYGEQHNYRIKMFYASQNDDEPNLIEIK